MQEPTSDFDTHTCRRTKQNLGHILCFVIARDSGPLTFTRGGIQEPCLALKGMFFATIVRGRRIVGTHSPTVTIGGKV